MIEGVTILIPAYNAMPYLRDAINSCLKQTFKKLEILIINDGSTDETENYLKTINDDRVKVINKKNEGLVATLNLGLEEAKFKWVARLDADDIMRNDRIEKQSKLIKKYDNVCVIGSNYGFIDSNNKILKLKKHLKLKNPPFFNPLEDPNIPHQGVLYRKDWILNLGGYRDLVPAEDLDLWIRVSRKYNIIVSNEVLTYIRILDSGISLKNFEKQRIMWKYVKECAQYEAKGIPCKDIDSWVEANQDWIKSKRKQWKAEKELRLIGYYLVKNEYKKLFYSIIKAIYYNPNIVINKLRSFNI